MGGKEKKKKKIPNSQFLYTDGGLSMVGCFWGLLAGTDALDFLCSDITSIKDHRLHFYHFCCSQGQNFWLFFLQRVGVSTGRAVSQSARLHLLNNDMG